MQLLMSPSSPYVRKCRVLLRETDLLDRVAEVSVTTNAFASDPQVIAANPMGKIPALVRADGPTLYDSRVICRFLDDFAGAGLYPVSQLWEILTLEATADGIMDSAVSMAYETRLRPDNEQSASWVEAQWEKVNRGVTALNDRWMSHLGGPLNIGQIAVGAALSYLDLRHDARGWRTNNAALDDWFASFKQRPAMQDTAA